MPCAHDTAKSLDWVAALVNTLHSDGTDMLPDVPALDAFTREWGWVASSRPDHRELDRVRALRPQLRRLWTLDERGVVKRVNEVLRQHDATPQLVRHDQGNYYLHATLPRAPLAERMAVEAAMAFADVVRKHELGRLRVCEAADCHDVLIDVTTNRSRRYCSTTCANRVNVAAFRARRRAGTWPPRPAGAAGPVSAGAVSAGTISAGAPSAR